ncbi:DUF3344 domain-containing protein [Streptomyces millisiae]|uniref:DUF3344 domain-containing protein n=1 Tax=Streptomyces millisiae TaxID=3075542 RepID=A0ABU2LKN7_9ACTN|nr:DUF3344 domain-containing protein [Streptomyces sp. DSM 44918]MDT0318145.1 DUF3344 domain-containing protein [Streptomyces sp. DSM 44918]
MRRLALFGLLVVAVFAIGPRPLASAAAGEASSIPFAERYHAVQHGGVVRAANSAITCGRAVLDTAPTCEDAQGGAAALGGQYEMAYIDVDSDPNTYNSSRAELRLPPGSRVTHARLYWGANIRVGEHKPPEDNGRVLIAEPGGQYKELLADSVIGHRDTGDQAAFFASADVTELVRWSRPGDWTVAQINVAMGHSAAGGWGGWTLVVAYENPAEPLREITLWDGFVPVDGDGAVADVRIPELAAAAGGHGSLGVVAGGGDPGRSGDTVTVRADDGRAALLGDDANPVGDVMNSTIADHGRAATQREPAHANTLGFDSDVLDVSDALADGAGALDVRFGSAEHDYQLGAVFLQVDAAA